ncbi:hypothetical protein Bca101_027001 [Brassica carinata]
MPSSTRSNKESQLLFSEDPASLERSIRKEIRSASIDTINPLSTDTDAPLPTETTSPSTDTFHPTSIDIRICISIDTVPRVMVAPIILIRDENGDLRDQEGHLRNEAGQKLNAQNEVIPEPETAPTGAVQPVEEAARTLADYNRPNQFYTNMKNPHTSATP